MPCTVEVDKLLLKRYLKLLALRTIVLASHYIAVMDALLSVSKYAQILQGSTTDNVDLHFNLTNVTTTTTIAPIMVGLTTKVPRIGPAKIGICNLLKPISQKDLDSLLLNFNMSFFLLLGFYGIAAIIFIVSVVVNLRLCICPIWQEPDELGRVTPTTWHKVRDMAFNLATFPCDTAIMSCIVGLYAVKRGSSGLACWECFKDPTCNTVKDFDGILFFSSLSLNVNFIFVLTIVFYKGFITYFRSTDPEKCDCHCVAPRCVTGCFVSLVVTSVVMMPPFLVMKLKYFDLKDIQPGFIADIMDKMMLVGIVIWAVAGVFVLIVVPLKMVLLARLLFPLVP